MEVPPLDEVRVSGGLADIAYRNAQEVPDHPVYARRVGGGWRDVTAEQFWSELAQVAAGLIASGIVVGDRVAIMSRNRYEWTLCDFALWAVGAVPVPIYDTASPDQVEWILTDSGAVAAIVETPWQARLVANLAPACGQVWCLESADLDRLRESGHEVATPALDDRRAAISPEDLATIIYTSGTTGRPKGCELTHGAFLFELGTAVAGLHSLFYERDGSTLLFIPLAHVFARIIQVGCALARLKMGHTAEVALLSEELADFAPTFILSVPRVFESVYTSASQNAHAAGRGSVFDRATETAIAYSRAEQSGRVGPILRTQRAAYDRLVYARIRAALGGKVTYAISGGAPLGDRLGHFLSGAGLTVLEGYGLTETAGACTLNLPGASRLGTVGRPLPGTGVRIEDTGEVLVRGPHLMRGYRHDVQATRQVIDKDGWLHTGDLGELDEDGYLRITGRLREILVTATGVRLAPEPLEEAVRMHRLVGQCMVVGTGQAFFAALITLDADAAAAWAAERGGPNSSPEALVTDLDVLAAVQQAVDEANQACATPGAAIRRFRLLPHPWTQRRGHLTPSGKLRRSVVMRDFAGDVERLYT